jgi:hypothetical protein
MAKYYNLCSNTNDIQMCTNYCIVNFIYKLLVLPAWWSGKRIAPP